MSKIIKISTIGLSLLKTSFTENLSDLSNKIINHLSNELENVIYDKPDLIVLPECCDYIETFNQEQKHFYFLNRDNSVLDYIKSVCVKHKCHIVYPTIRVSKNGDFYNCAYFIDRSGEILGIYEKNHLFIEEIEINNYKCGKEPLVLECELGKVAFVICFDLNINQLREYYIKEKPDLIIFPSMFHGGIMQNYWAYSCRSFFVSAVVDLESAIIAPTGELIAHSTSYYHYVTATINLDSDIFHLDYNKCKLEKAKKKYGSKIKIQDPGYLGSVLLSSETDDFDINFLIEEFKLEKLDDYIERSILIQQNNRR